MRLIIVAKTNQKILASNISLKLISLAKPCIKIDIINTDSTIAIKDSMSVFSIVSAKYLALVCPKMCCIVCLYLFNLKLPST